MTISFYVLDGSVYTTEVGAGHLARYAAEEDIDCPAVTVAPESKLAALDSAFERARPRLCVAPAGHAPGSMLWH